VKAQLELKPLVFNANNVDDVPEKAVECSAFTFNIFQSIIHNLEVKHNESKDLHGYIDQNIIDSEQI